MKIVFIGAGNVATVLGRLFQHKGHEIIQILGRNKEKAEQLANELNCEVGLSVDQITQQGDIYIIAIQDDNVAILANQLKLPGKLVVHTAGTLPLKTLKNISERTGVIWPLQSLRKEVVSIPPEIPFIIDGSNKEVIAYLYKSLASVSEKIIHLKEAERIKLHLSAVVVSNFTNHLYALAEEYCTINNLPYSFLYPLIVETAKRINIYNAKDVQTGPSMRGDYTTMNAHLKLLKEHQYLKELYKVFDKSIRKVG